MKSNQALHKVITHHSKALALFEVLGISIIPVFLIRTGFIPPGERYWVLVAVLVYAIVRIVMNRWTWKQIGFRTDTLRYWGQYVVAGMMAMMVVWLVSLLPQFPDPVWTIRQVAYVLIISVFVSLVQEFLYRSFLMQLLTRVSTNRWIIIGINSCVFAYLHSFYPHLNILIPLTFFGGVLFAWLYTKYPNFWLVAGLHVAINLTALLLGLFPITLR